MEANQQLQDWRSMDFRTKCIRQMETIMQKFPTHQLSIRDLENKIYLKSTSKDEYLNFIKTFMQKLQNTSRVAQAGGAAGMIQPQQQQQQNQQGTFQQQNDGMQNMGGMMGSQGGQMGLSSGQGSQQNLGMLGQYQQQGTSQMQSMNQFACQPSQMGQGPSGVAGGVSGGVASFTQQPMGMMNQQRPQMMMSGIRPSGDAGNMGMGGMGATMGQTGGQMPQMMGMAGQRPQAQFVGGAGQQGIRGAYPDGMGMNQPMSQANITPEMRQQLDRMRQQMAYNRQRAPGDQTGQFNQTPGNFPSLTNQPRMPGAMGGQSGGPTGQPQLLSQLISGTPSASIPTPNYRVQGPQASMPMGLNQPDFPFTAGARLPAHAAINALRGAQAGGSAGTPPSQTNQPSPASVASPDPAAASTIKTTDEAYKKKLEDLQKYKDVIQKIILRFQNDPERKSQLGRLQALQEFICNPKPTMTYEVLLKCENAVKTYVGTPQMSSDAALPSPGDVKTPISVPGLTPLIGVANTPSDSLVTAQRPALKPLADAVSKALSDLDEDQFAALCQAWHTRMPAHLDDGLHLYPGVEDLPEEDDFEDMDDIEGADEFRVKREDGLSLREWKSEIPYELQMETSYLLTEFDIILDVNMHPDGELIPDHTLLYLCCGLKKRPGLAQVPPVGVAVPLSYPKEAIDFKEMSVADYDGTEFLEDVRECLRGKLVELGAENGCSLTSLLNSWKQAVILTQQKSRSGVA